MEPNRTLESTLSFALLRDISTHDLDALLQFDSPPLTFATTQHSSCSLQIDEDAASTPDQLDFSNLQYNREKLSGAMDSQISVNAFARPSAHTTSQLDLSWNLSNLTELTPSIVISTQEPEQIVVNDSEMPVATTEDQRRYEDAYANVTDNNLCVSPVPTNASSSGNRNDTLQFPVMEVKNELIDLSSMQGDSQPQQDMTFAAEFAKFQDFDFDLELSPLNEIDFEQLDELERSYKSQRNEQSTPPHGDAKPRLHKTQVTPTKQVSPNRNVTNSCPMLKQNILPSPMLKQNSLPSPISTPNTNADPIKLLMLEFSESSQDSAKAYNEMYLTNTSEAPTAAFDLSRRNADKAVNNIEDNSATLQTKAQSTLVNVYNNSTADATLVPSSVKQLYDLVKTQYSDFAFVYALSAQLCQDRVPMDCFVNLKMGLLLSLASIGHNPDRPPIPIVALGNDTYMANYLLTNIGQLAARFVGPTDDVRAPSNTSQQRNVNWIEADPILLAKGGVFFVGDWSRLKLARADQLFKIIECSRVPVERTTQVYTLEAAIWTHWRSSKGNAKDQQNFNKIVKIFGIPICMDDENHEVLVNYLLEQSSVRVFESTIDHLSISADDMRNFLHAISKRTVDLTPEASLLLQKYFVASRIARPECLTKQSFVILKQFAESFAKLCFRHEVLEADASAAIFMCERFVQSVFGVNEHSPPAFESHNFIGTVDAYMVTFQKWLQGYIEQYHDRE